MAILAYCFMPDHLHLLVEGTSGNSSLLEFVRTAKQRSGFAFARTSRIRLWQRYGFERVLRSDEEALSVAAYVVANPVRAGLIDDVRLYPFAGSDVYAMEDLIEVFRDGRAG
jgi:putative transposase